MNVIDSDYKFHPSLDGGELGVGTFPSSRDNYKATLEIDQGEVIRQIPKGTTINVMINPGSCVCAITCEEDEGQNIFTAGHFQAGEIVRELTALASMGKGVTTVYQGPVRGEIQQLYTTGQQLNPTQIKRAFRGRDRNVLGGLV